MRKWLTFVVAAAATVAVACINDRDAIEMESKRFPGVMETAAGRFERNPPKYYEMRLERIEKQGGPKTLHEFDDKGAALGRLGRDAEAIQVMAEKAAKMRAMGKEASKMDWYRYHANLGTFQAHKWFADGAHADKMSDLKEGAKNIERSIELNPDAHFGREYVQLNIMRWVIDIKSGTTKEPYIEWLSGKGRFDRKKELEGLSGLVVLGAAWENVDVFHSIATIVGDGALKEFVGYRVRELESSGKKSLTGAKLTTGTGEDGQKKLFADWRKSSNEWHANRVAFMESEFAYRHHPDTDENFWIGYKETRKPTIPRRPTNFFFSNGQTLVIGGALFATLIAVTAFVISTVRRRQREARTF